MTDLQRRSLKEALKLCEDTKDMLVTLRNKICIDNKISEVDICIPGTLGSKISNNLSSMRCWITDILKE